MNKNGKHFLFFLLAIVFASPIFCYSYRIDDVVFEITGQTKKSAIQRNIEIDTKTVFEDEKAFLQYKEKLLQQFENTRLFQEVEITYSASEPENDLCSVTLEIKTMDTLHFLVLPYPKFTTSDGLIVKLKLKDMNFMGTMNELNSSFNFNWKPDEEGNQFKIFEPEFTFEYDFPFKIGTQDFTWTNDHSISYKWGKTSPEWDFETGIKWSKPIGIATLGIAFTQGFVRNLDYKKYGDDTYLSEALNASIPIKLLETQNFGSLILSPYMGINYKFDPFNMNGYSGFGYTEYENWQADGISLMGPVLSLGTELSIGNINWTGNYRNGISASFTPSMSYNFASYINEETNKLSFRININANAYKSYDYIGFNARFRGFGYITDAEKRISGSENVDSYLRGIVDGRKSDVSAYKQAETPLALVFNFDMPIHIVTTDWENFFLTKKIPFMKYLNFEFQISPFFDFALIKTTSERHGVEKDRTFAFKDGFYTAGLEALVFPERWKSLEVRASIGYDIGTLLLGSVIESSWRNKLDSEKPWYKQFEISIGIGLHY